MMMHYVYIYWIISPEMAACCCCCRFWRVPEALRSSRVSAWLRVSGISEARWHCSGRASSSGRWGWAETGRPARALSAAGLCRSRGSPRSSTPRSGGYSRRTKKRTTWTLYWWGSGGCRGSSGSHSSVIFSSAEKNYLRTPGWRDGESSEKASCRLPTESLGNSPRPQCLWTKCCRTTGRERNPEGNPNPVIPETPWRPARSDRRGSARPGSEARRGSGWMEALYLTGLGAGKAELCFCPSVNHPACFELKHRWSVIIDHTDRAGIIIINEPLISHVSAAAAARDLSVLRVYSCVPTRLKEKSSEITDIFNNFRHVSFFSHRNSRQKWETDSCSCFFLLFISPAPQFAYVNKYRSVLQQG